MDFMRREMELITLRDYTSTKETGYYDKKSDAYIENNGKKRLRKRRITHYK